MTVFQWALSLYVFILNIIAFSLMGIDKSRARKGAWRISEKTLFLSAVLGGSLGATLGMHCFRHKTGHWYFRYGMPLILLLQLALCCCLFYNLSFQEVSCSLYRSLP